MKYRRLGNTGLMISEISLGSWITYGSTRVTQEDCDVCLTAAYEKGVNFLDGAEGYAGGLAETAMAQTIKNRGWKRSDLVLSTKVYFGGTGPNKTGLSHKHIIEAVEASLKRYQTEYVDLVFCHRPDLKTPLEETVRAMDQLIRQGKAFYWGTSEWSAADIGMAWGIALANGWHPPVMEQPQYNMLSRQRFEFEYDSLFKRIGYGTTVWSPLSGGVLTGKYNQGIPADSRFSDKGLTVAPEILANIKARLINQNNISRVENLKPIAQKLECTLAQLALAWVLKNPNVSCAIIGATKPQQVEENVKASDITARMTPDILSEIEGVLQNKPDVPFSR